MEQIRNFTKDAVEGAFWGYVEDSVVDGAVQGNERWKECQKGYGDLYDRLVEMLGRDFHMVDSLLNHLRAMHDIESEAFYRLGIRDGVRILS